MAHGWIWAIFGVLMAGGWLRFGLQGALLIFSAGVFIVLLQFSRAMRALQVAGRAPVGQVGSAVMLNAQLRKGMRLTQILYLTRSLGNRCDTATADPAIDAFRWTDASGSTVEVELQHGRLRRWTLERPGEEPPAAARSAAAAAEGEPRPIA